jgi:para-nitrobenzyl esterase
MWAWAQLQVQSGRSPVYFYYFEQQPPFPATSVHHGWGASHFAELWYVFDHLNQDAWDWSVADRRLAKLMCDYWTNFAKSGDPNRDGLPPWPAFDGDAKVLHLREPVVVEGLPNRASLQVFDAIYGSLRGQPLNTQ